MPVGDALGTCPDVRSVLDQGPVRLRRQGLAEAEVARRSLGVADVGEFVNVRGSVVAEGLMDFLLIGASDVPEHVLVPSHRAGSSHITEINDWERTQLVCSRRSVDGDKDLGC